MASFLLTAGVGAILNAGNFIGGSYLAKYLTGKDQDSERKRHDQAMEKYEKDYNYWKEAMGRGEVWREQQEKQEQDAGYKFKSTDDALRLYGKLHPEFSDYYQPSKEQKQGEMLFTGLSVAEIVYGISKLV